MGSKPLGSSSTSTTPSALSLSGSRGGQVDDDQPQEGFGGLPYDVQVEVAGWLDIGELRSLGMVSRRMRHVANEPSIWRHHCYSRFFHRYRRPTSGSSVLDVILEEEEAAKAPKLNADDQSTAIGRGVAQAKRDGNPDWNEWKRVYHRFHTLEKGWRTAPTEAKIPLREATGCIWLDSRKLYTCQHGVSAYDPDTGEMLKKYLGGSSNLSRVQASEREGIVAGLGQSSLDFWNLHTGQHLGSMQNKNSQSLWSMHFHDKRLVCGGYDLKLDLIDIETQTHIADGGFPSGHTSVIRSLQLEGNTLASGGGNGDNTLKVWDLRDYRKPTADYNVFSSGVWCCYFADDMIAGGSMAQACLLDMRTGKKLWDNPSAHSNHINVIQFDSMKLVSGSGDSSVKVWDMRTFDCWWSCQTSGSAWSGLYEDDVLVVANSSAMHVSRLCFEGGLCELEPVKKPETQDV